ncbi:MAG: hypothetical protein BM564_11450 [Bacteroidetes bacterium MedPE-SWsnd-G2]|nr:MAG: hypothetical protein BM564_11450 [Bacteroidetes bacterium MedPE-SWsnd-G2]
MRVFRIQQNNVEASYEKLALKFKGSHYHKDQFTLNSEFQKIDMHYYPQFPGIEVSVMHIFLEDDTLFVDESDDENMVVFQFMLNSFLKFNVNTGLAEKTETISGASMYNAKYPLELLVPKNKDVKYVTIRLKLDMIQGFKQVEWAQFDELLFNPKPWMLFETLNIEMEALIKDLFFIQKTEAGRRGYSIAKSIELVTAFMKQFGQRKNEKNAIGPITVAPELLLQIKNEIIEDFNQPISVEAIARNHGMSKQKLRVNFKNFFGKSVNQLWQQLRHEEAQRRLRYSDEAITSIALSLGFNDSTHFAKGFKEREGVSPSEYRNT